MRKTPGTNPSASFKDPNRTGMSSRPATGKTAPTNSQMMITQLQQKFINIYQHLLSLKQKRIEIEEENLSLMKLLEEEKINQEKNIQKVEEEIDSLKKQNNQLLQVSAEEDAQVVDLERQIEEKEKVAEELQSQLKVGVEDLENEYAKCELSNKHLMYMENEQLNLKKKIIESERRIEELDQQLAAVEEALAETQIIVKNLLSENQQLEEDIKSKIVEQSDQEDEAKVNSQNYRALLKKHSANQSKLQMEQKALDKLKEELQSKIKRLNVLLLNNEKLERKVKTLEKMEQEYNELVAQNEALQFENEKLKKKMLGNVHSDFEKPVYKINTNDPAQLKQAKEHHKLQFSKVLADEEKLLSHISHHTFNSHLVGKESEYVQQKDAENEKNFKRILEAKELENLKSQLSQQLQYIQELEKNAQSRDEIIDSQQNEIASLQENIAKMDVDIEKAKKERELYRETYEQKKMEVEAISQKYKETLESLPIELQEELYKNQFDDENAGDS